jgi:hypothetical protein
MHDVYVSQNYLIMVIYRTGDVSVSHDYNQNHQQAHACMLVSYYNWAFLFHAKANVERCSRKEVSHLTWLSYIFMICRRFSIYQSCSQIDLQINGGYIYIFANQPIIAVSTNF